MPKYKIDVYVEDNYVTTYFLEATDQEDADNQARAKVYIDTDVEELD